MKFSNLRALLAFLLFGIVAAIPTLPWSHDQYKPFAFQYELTTSERGTAEIFYDRGKGVSAYEATKAVFFPKPSVQTVSLPLPEGVFRGFRFDPSDWHGSQTISSPRLVDRDGKVVKRFEASDFLPGHQVVVFTPNPTGFSIELASDANDPQIGLPLRTWLPLEVPVLAKATAWGVRAAGFAVSAWLLINSAFSLAAMGGVQRFYRNAVSAHPRKVLLAAALAAVVLSDFPIVFGGKSFLGPNFSGGTNLLYDGFPTLPKTEDGKTVLDHNSDVGASFWAHVPAGVIEGNAYRDGEFPWWNRYNSCGLPLVGQGQSMIGDPIQFVVSLIGAPTFAWDLKFLSLKVLFCFGLGLCVLLITEALLPSVLVAASAAFIGFFTYRINHPAFFSVCEAPWVLVCWLYYLRAASRKAVLVSLIALFVSNYSLLNSGTVKEAYMLVLTLNLAGIVTALFSRDTWRARLLVLIGPAISGAVFVLVSAPLWMVFLDSLNTAYTAYNIPQVYQIQPSLILGFFDELFYRPLTHGALVFNPSMNLFLALGLLFWLAASRAETGQRWSVALATAAVFPAAMVFGIIPPSLVARIPFLGNVAHVDNSFSCGLLILCSVIAGVGFHQAIKRLADLASRPDFIRTFALLAIVVTVWIAFRQAIHRPSSPNDTPFGPIRTGNEMEVAPFVWWSLATSVTASVSIYWILRRAALGKLRFTPALTVLLVLAVGILHWRFAMQPEVSGFETYTIRTSSRVNIHARSPAIEAIKKAQGNEPSRVLGLNGNLFPGWNAVYKLEAINGPDAVLNPYYRELTVASPLNRIWNWRICIHPDQVAESKTYLDFLNVRYYADLKSDQGLLGKSLKPVKMADLDVYESTTAWPRAFFTDRLVEIKDVADLTSKVMTGDGRPFAALYHSAIEREPGLATLGREPASRLVVPATEYTLTANGTSFSLNAPGAGIVVLGEVWQEHSMRVWIDGQRARPFRVNHAFRGVYLPRPGQHRIKFEYYPHNHFLHVCLAFGGLFLGLASSAAYLRFRNA